MRVWCKSVTLCCEPRRAKTLLLDFTVHLCLYAIGDGLIHGDSDWMEVRRLCSGPVALAPRLPDASGRCLVHWDNKSAPNDLAPIVSSRLVE
jgi:hypothetical protein